MNIKGLRAFTQIMTTGTLSAAAKSMNTSVSALSRQLALFEAELGLILFSRNKQRLKPTEEGEALFREAERILDSIDELPGIVSEIRKGTRRRMRIIIMPRMANSIIAPALSKFMEDHPDMEITIDVQPRRFLERWVASRKYDFGLGAIPTFHSGVEFEKIYSIPVVAVLHPNHKLASRSSLRLEELSDERFITMPPNTLLGQQVADILDGAGIVPKSPIQASQALLCCDLVAQGLGITITDAMIPGIYGSALKMIAIEPAISMNFGLLSPLGVSRTKETQQLVEIIKTQAQSFGFSLL